MRLAIVQPPSDALTATFIRAHGGLPFEVATVDGFPPRLNGEPVLPQSFSSVARLGWYYLRGVRPRDGWDRWALTGAYLEAFRRCRPDAVLAEYGTTGVRVLEACRRNRLPLVVHFHGYDAYRRSVLEAEAENYRRMFDYAYRIIAVSKAMRQRLLVLGAPQEHVAYVPYGVDTARFCAAAPAEAAPVFLAVGRFVEKKAPHLVLLAFARVLSYVPDARLRMIGDGPLLRISRDLAAGLGVSHAVTFLGAQPHSTVQAEMARARAFVQHSVEASDGDCEGTPNTILEAGASGLPVVSTRHAGIPDVVIEGETGFLVEERDVDAMATRMLELCRIRALAGTMGRSAQEHVRRCHSLERSISALSSIIESCSSEESREPR